MSFLVKFPASYFQYVSASTVIHFAFFGKKLMADKYFFIVFDGLL